MGAEMTTANKLVNQTFFENLVINISAKSRDDFDFETTVIKPQREIIKAIISVYFFLRTQFKLHYRPITIDEFENTECQLKKFARSFVNNYWNFIFRPSRTLAWKYYLKFGYFPENRTTFKNGEWKISSLFFNCYWSCYPQDTDHVYERGTWYHNFDPRSIIMRNEPWMDYQKLLVPPNIRELVKKLYEERQATDIATISENRR